MQPVARTFRKWLLHLSTLVPASQDDWLEFRRNVVHLLPDFKAYFTLVTTATNSSNTAPALPSSAPLLAKDAVQKAADKQMKKLMRETNTRVGTFQKTRRKHLFGHDKLERSGGDPTDTITCTDLSRSCLLLIIAGFLASFNPQDTDTNFLSSSGGVRRKKRVKKTGQSSAAAAEQISQLLIGPRIFTLQRLLAIYLNLRAEASADLSDRFIVNEAREDIFTHVRCLAPLAIQHILTDWRVLVNLNAGACSWQRWCACSFSSAHPRPICSTTSSSGAWRTRASSRRPPGTCASRSNRT